VKFLRLLLNCLVLALALVAVLVALAFAPGGANWVAQAMLARQPALQGSLGSLSARFGRLDVSELQLKTDGAVLTMPSLEAELPLTTALWDRKLPLRGWWRKAGRLTCARYLRRTGRQNRLINACCRRGPAAPAPVEAVSAQDVARIFRGTLSRLALPCDVSLDGADLEGDVVVAAPVGSAPARVHVIIKVAGWLRDAMETSRSTHRLRSWIRSFRW